MSEIPSNMVTWFQIPADDTGRAWRFYGAVFGWNEEKAYADRKQSGAINGAIAERESEGETPRLVIRVDDLDATARAIREAGGGIVTEPTEIPGLGMAFAVFRDTEGNVLNIVGDAP
jgi:predicted enzyme related to lactoylglutathione lyase